LRCPIVMGVANRALSAPINIHCDHSDMMGSRDSCWVQVYAENSQEAYDWIIQAFKIAEDPNVLLPVSVNIDGFILSHSMEGVNVLEDEEVYKFLSTRKPVYKVDPDNPITVGALCLPDFYFEVKRQQVEAMKEAYNVIKKVNREFKEIAGRKYYLVDNYCIEDAEAAIMCLGSSAGTAKAVARNMRKKGLKVGVIKPCVYRPFPTDEILEATRNLKALAVLDRACSFGAPYGSLCSDVIASLYTAGRKLVVFNGIYGLGGRDLTPTQIETIFENTLKAAETGMIEEPVKFIGVRE
ncbi:TPA: pyruvate ferredoxin oxidoreductase, partial [Candidatus Bathyarchaeota archaeon]|nr:pyruvate ferredoxin oxidoreductase [Candidatus Bathyarchaeota archaeon]